MKFSTDTKMILDAQKTHWDSCFAANPALFGEKPGEPAVYTVALLRGEGKKDLLELGAGHGRDAIFFAGEGFNILATDYAESGLEAIAVRAKATGVKISLLRHDVRQALPLPDACQDACYAHMLLCMALTDEELESLFLEVHRVLRPGGLFVYTVRHHGDPHYGKGKRHGEDIYEYEGFIIHFFSREKVRQLASGFIVEDVSEFAEGLLPRRLLRVTIRKN